MASALTYSAPKKFTFFDISYRLVLLSKLNMKIHPPDYRDLSLSHQTKNEVKALKENQGEAYSKAQNAIQHKTKKVIAINSASKGAVVHLVA